ncbi:hypothetical protein COB52_00080 [Candidatus Kaiserbacteria bacterium]|nr:MAG: hypothetical protein COB52_00080 [Candidatus Kaiserbacteria bacterium]
MLITSPSIIGNAKVTRPIFYYKDGEENPDIGNWTTTHAQHGGFAPYATTSGSMNADHIAIRATGDAATGGFSSRYARHTQAVLLPDDHDTIELSYYCSHAGNGSLYCGVGTSYSGTQYASSGLSKVIGAGTKVMTNPAMAGQNVYMFARAYAGQYGNAGLHVYSFKSYRA